MALRTGFTRYAFSIQYHGSSFLGFPYLKEQEDTILPDGTDLRGYRSVEGRLRDAFSEMVGAGHYENIRVSSRTDRGVHALKNTCHVDLTARVKDGKLWNPSVLKRGLNYYLSQQGGDIFQRSNNVGDSNKINERYVFRRAKRKLDHWSFHYPMNELRILNVVQAPLTMANEYHKVDNTQPPVVDWNIRFSAIQRTYMYRILAYGGDGAAFAVPFEWDRSWRISPRKFDKDAGKCETPNVNKMRGLLDVSSMKEAASYLVGTHDFSSFRSAGCQRSSPVMTLQNIDVVAQPYGEPLYWEATGGFLGMGDVSSSACLPQLVTIKVQGNSFVYHQVRNIIGALVSVGRGSTRSSEIKDILEARDRTVAPPMAPAHGLFLVNVKHDDIEL